MRDKVSLTGNEEIFRNSFRLLSFTLQTTIIIFLSTWIVQKLRKKLKDMLTSSLIESTL